MSARSEAIVSHTVSSPRIEMVDNYASPAHDSLPLLTSYRKCRIDDIVYSLDSFWSLLWPVSASSLISSICAVYVYSKQEESQASAYLIYRPTKVTYTGSDESYTHFRDALANSIAMICVITIATIGVAICYRLRLSIGVFIYLIVAATALFGFIGGQIICALVKLADVPCDIITLGLVVWNFSMVGIISVFHQKGCPSKLTQIYLVLTSILMAWKLSYLPEWTAWILLITLGCYDICAVFSAYGPLQWLISSIQDEGRPLPGMLYETPVSRRTQEEDACKGDVKGTYQSDFQRDLKDDLKLFFERNSPENVGQIHGIIQEYQFQASQDMWKDLYLKYGISNVSVQPNDLEYQGKIMIHNHSSNLDPVKDNARTIRLGLGDFIFYSLLVARSAMFSFAAMASSFVSILMGLAMTLLLHGLYDRPLPALPLSIFLGASAYLLMSGCTSFYVSFLSFAVVAV